MNECPCHNCICVPVCRHKEYFYLIDDCELLLKLLYRGAIIDTGYRTNAYPSVIGEVYKELQPHHWVVKHISKNNSFVRVHGVNLT
jgi:hypothetical protein